MDKKEYVKPRMRVIDSPELLSTGLNAVYSGIMTEAEWGNAKANSLFEEEEEESWCEDPRLVTGFEIPGL